MFFTLKSRLLLSALFVAGIAFSASAHTEVLFDSLHSPNTGVEGADGVNTPPFGASFATGSSAVHPTDVALLLNQATGSVVPGDTFTVSLVGGFPLANVIFIPSFGLNVGPGLSGPVLGSITLPMSDLSTHLAVQHFNQFADIALKPNSFYWIDLNVFGPPPPSGAGPFIGWGVTNDVSGPGVLQGYNSSSFTDGGFFPNKPTPPPNNGLPPFQMEVLGAAVPEPSTWALMLLGFAGLGYAAFRRSRKARLTRRSAGPATPVRRRSRTGEYERRNDRPWSARSRPGRCS
jgi:hypothetical protein